MIVDSSATIGRPAACAAATGALNVNHERASFESMSTGSAM
jgi:hypothetical protein